MTTERAGLIETALAAGLGGVITAAIIAFVPSATRWIVRPATYPGAIVAFDKPCPAEGWEPYTVAEGRVILGAGTGANKDQNGKNLSLRQIHETGGEEVHQLTEKEMPAHQHKYTYLDTQGGSCGLSGCHSQQISKDSSTTAAGGDQPHNNMPPFVVLYYCKAK
ncbi:hypothetical protein [Massilia sp. Root418]|uniref:phage baseplate protein n=1 Tax=Massilia sp. Root418 TaxID=1736532 RepID=UPI0012F6F616|nr:hypothetical protein [Massilia sp. Root418]